MRVITDESVEAPRIDEQALVEMLDERADEQSRPRWMSMLRNVVVGFTVFLLVGNGLIMVSMAWFRLTSPDDDLASQIDIDNFTQVDERVLRGAAPSKDDYTTLASLGVSTVVDLRAEASSIREDAAAEAAGLVRVSLPVRDGQIPSEEQVEQFLEIVDEAPGRVFLHCGAGVGRTGAMAAFYLNATGQTEGTEALRQNLAVGPPSLEQIAFSVTTRDGDYRKPLAPVTAISRVLDAPRRIWHNLT